MGYMSRSLEEHNARKKAARERQKANKGKVTELRAGSSIQVPAKPKASPKDKLPGRGEGGVVNTRIEDVISRSAQFNRDLTPPDSPVRGQ